jgi:hypothetical protein
MFVLYNGGIQERWDEKDGEDGRIMNEKVRKRTRLGFQ